MTGKSWLMDGNRIASIIKCSSAKQAWTTNPSTTCPNCTYNIDNTDIGHDWPGLPLGVKFDPSDAELMCHLLAKHGKGGESHPLIDEFIPTLNEEHGICYTHPEKLPGVRQDGAISHFFHRVLKAYNTGTRKRRKINTNDELATISWRKSGNTKPVIVEGEQVGCKKIMVLYRSPNGGKQEKTDWVMHQYHLGPNDSEKDGDFVVSKLFFQHKSGEKKELGYASAFQMDQDVPEPPLPMDQEVHGNKLSAKERGSPEANVEGKHDESGSVHLHDDEHEPEIEVCSQLLAFLGLDFDELSGSPNRISSESQNLTTSLGVTAHAMEHSKDDSSPKLGMNSGFQERDTNLTVSADLAVESLTVLEDLLSLSPVGFDPNHDYNSEFRLSQFKFSQDGNLEWYGGNAD